jgi:hypothetical protein
VTGEGAVEGAVAVAVAGFIKKELPAPEAERAVKETNNVQ